MKLFFLAKQCAPNSLDVQVQAKSCGSSGLLVCDRFEVALAGMLATWEGSAARWDSRRQLSGWRLSLIPKAGSLILGPGERILFCFHWTWEIIVDLFAKLYTYLHRWCRIFFLPPCAKAKLVSSSDKDSFSGPSIDWATMVHDRGSQSSELFKLFFNLSVSWCIINRDHFT